MTTLVPIISYEPIDEIQTNLVEYIFGKRLKAG